MRFLAVAPVFCLVLALWPASLPAQTGHDADAAYARVRDAYLALKGDSKRQRFRDNYLKIIEGFEGFEEKHPGHARAADALYNAGQLGWDLYRVSRVRGDLARAMANFKALEQGHPDSRLADDALFLGGRILLEHGGDKTEAFRHFDRCAKRYPRGDMSPSARELMGRLSQYRPGPEDLPPTPPKKRVLARSTAWRGEAAKKSVEVREVKTWSDAGSTRVVIYLSGPVRFREAEIPAEPKKRLPRRYYIDLQKAVLGEGARAPVPVGDDQLEQVRSGQFSPDTVRVVLDVAHMQSARAFPMTHPDRLVVDVHSEAGPDPESIARVSAVASGSRDAGAQDARDGGAELEKKVAAGPKIPLSVQAGLKVRRVVVDAGHGGKDHGAVGKGGAREKDVALAISKKLASRLEKLGLEVILTRTDDTFIPLEERTAIANTRGADLFISIHANAHPRRDRRGVSTYYLDISSDRYSMRLAALENATTEKSVSDLQFILADLAKRSNVDESAALADAVQKRTVRTLQRRWKNVRSLGVKSALFYVLLGAKMPAVLVETSFISNAVEEKRLTSAAYQDKVADGIVDGVKVFLENRRALAFGATAR